MCHRGRIVYCSPAPVCYNPCPPTYYSYSCPPVLSVPPVVHSGGSMFSTDLEKDKNRLLADLKSGKVTYSELKPIVQDKIRATLWAGPKDFKAIEYTERMLDSTIWGKEIKFSIRAQTTTPAFEYLLLKKTESGKILDHKFTSGAYWSSICGSENSEFEVTLTKNGDRHDYTIRFRKNFIGGMKWSIGDISYYAYTHDEKKPEVKKDDPPPSATPTLKAKSPDKDPEEEKRRNEELARKEKELRDKEEALRQKQLAWEKQQAAEKAALAAERKAIAEQLDTLQKLAKGLEEKKAQLAALEEKLKNWATLLANQAKDQGEKERVLAAADMKNKSAAEALAQDQGKLEEAKQALAKAAKDLEGRKAATDKDLDDRKRELDRIAADLKRRQDKLDLQVAAAKEQKDELDRMLGDLKKQKDALAKLGEQQGVTAKELDEKEKKVEAARKQLDQDKKDLDAMKLAKKEERDALEKKIKGLEADVGTLEASLKEDREKARKLDAERRKQDDKIKDLETTIAGLKGDLDKGTQANRELAGELGKLKGQLPALEAKIAEQAKELAIVKKGPDDLKVEMSKPVPIQPLPVTWAKPVAVTPESRPLKVEDLKLPEWIRLSNAGRFDERALEDRNSDNDYIGFLAGDDATIRITITKAVNDRRDLVEKGKAGKDDIAAHEAFEKAEKDYATYIKDSYKPLMNACDELANSACLIAKYAALHDGSGEGWTKDEIKKAKRAVEVAIAHYDIAVHGYKKNEAHYTKLGIPNEHGSDAGIDEKIKDVEARIAALRAKKKLEDPEKNQLDFLDKRLARLRDFHDLLTKLKPHVEALRKGQDGDLVKALFSDKDAVKPGKPGDLAELKSALDKAFSSAGLDGLAALKGELKKISGTALSSAKQVFSSFGTEEGIAQLEANLALLKKALEDKKTETAYLSALNAKREKEVFDRIAKPGTVDLRVEGYETYYRNCFGKMPSSDDVKKLVREFVTAEDPKVRTAAFQKLVQPFAAKDKADYLAEIAEAIAETEKAAATAKKAKALALGWKLAEKTDAAYLAFAGSKANLLLPFDLFDSNEKAQEFRDTEDQNAKPDCKKAKDAIAAELKFLEPLAKSDGGGWVAGRIKILEERNGNIEDWEKRVKKREDEKPKE